MAVPKKIFTLWLGPAMPKQQADWIQTQRIPGYTHKVISLENCILEHKYIRQCLGSVYGVKKWVKMADYLRVWYLYTEGGIYLDSDVEILPGRNFDGLLGDRIFMARENNGFLGTAVIGAEAGHPFFSQVLRKMTENFRGDDDLVFQSGMETLSCGHRDGFNIDGFKVYESTRFFPYDHQENTVNITPETVTYHHFTKSWL